MKQRLGVAAAAFVLISISASTMGSAQISLPPSGIIRTVAGNGVQGYSGDGDDATSASMRWILGLATDSDGNLYIADSGNFRVRKVIAATGKIETVAGNGSAEFSGDGRLATQTGLGSPVAVAVDGAKNVYFLTPDRVLRVSPSDGILRTVAGGNARGYSGDGGPAVQAEINGATGIALDAAGNIYIADFSNNRVRRVKASTGIIDTIAGTGEAGFSGDGGPGNQSMLNGPYGVATDRDGNVYIGNYFDCRIRKLSASTGLIETIAGTGACGYSGDGGPASAAQLGQIYGIAIDLQGNLYVAESDNNRVRMIAATSGLISTVAGDGSVGLAGDNRPAISAQLESIYGLTVDQAGYLYVSNSAPGLVRAIGPGAAQNPSSYNVALSASDLTPMMGEAITLKATVTSNLGLPAISGTIIWFAGTTELGKSSVDENGFASFVTKLGAAGDQKISASYTGTPSGFGTLDLPVSGFALSGPTNSSVTVALGQNAQILVNAAAFHGFKGTVDLACSGLPYPGVCSLSAATATFTDNVTVQNIAVTVQTTPGAAPSPAHAGLHTRMAIVAFGTLMLWGLGRKRRRFYSLLVLLPLILVMTFETSGCSSTAPQRALSDSTTTPTLQTGTYAVVLSASSGNETVELPISVTVK